jgi:serine/threonine-protein kinase HipA
MVAAIQRTVRVALGEAALSLGALTYGKDEKREYSAFAYGESWLADASRFEISPDLPLIAGHQFRKAPAKEDSIFHFAFADTVPDGCGCRVIARDHARRPRPPASPCRARLSPRWITCLAWTT